MSFDPYRSNWAIGNTTGVTPPEWMIRYPGAEWIRKAPAGENLGLGTNLRFPLIPIDVAGFPCRLSGGSLYKITLATYLQYCGLLLAPVKSGYEAMYIRKGKVRLPVGKTAITENTLVMCEDDPTGTVGDIVPQSDVETTIFQSTGVIGANTNIDIGEDLDSIASATLYDQSAGTTTALTVVTAVPGAGEIRLVGTPPSAVIELGDALAANDIVSIFGVEEEHLSRHTVGIAMTGGTARVSATDYSKVEVELV